MDAQRPPRRIPFLFRFFEHSLRRPIRQISPVCRKIRLRRRHDDVRGLSRVRAILRLPADLDQICQRYPLHDGIYAVVSIRSDTGHIECQIDLRIRPEFQFSTLPYGMHRFTSFTFAVVSIQRYVRRNERNLPSHRSAIYFFLLLPCAFLRAALASSSAFFASASAFLPVLYFAPAAEIGRGPFTW